MAKPSIKESVQKQQQLAQTTLAQAREEADAQDAAAPDKQAMIAKLKAVAATDSIAKVSLSDIVMENSDRRYNVRSAVVKDDEFTALIRDIEKNGVKQNIQLALVITPDESDYALLCIAGQRRLEAARAALVNLTQSQATEKRIQRVARIPARIQIFKTTYEAVDASMSENLLRTDLPLVDLALGYNSLYQAAIETDVKDKDAIGEISKDYGRDTKTIRLYIKLATFPVDVLDQIRAHSNISTRDVFKYLVEPRNHGEDHIRQLATEFFDQAKPIHSSAPKTRSTTDFQIEMATLIRKSLPPIKLKITGTANRGKLLLSWKSEAERQAILTAIAQDSVTQNDL